MSRRNPSKRGCNGTHRENSRLILMQHQAAVKVLAWCPFHRGLLTSGGEAADRTLKFIFYHALVALMLLLREC